MDDISERAVSPPSPASSMDSLLSVDDAFWTGFSSEEDGSGGDNTSHNSPRKREFTEMNSKSILEGTPSKRTRNIQDSSKEITPSSQGTDEIASSGHLSELVNEIGRTLNVDHGSKTARRRLDEPLIDATRQTTVPTATSEDASSSSVTLIEQNVPSSSQNETYESMCGAERQFLEVSIRDRQESRSQVESEDDFDFYGMGESVRHAVFSTFGVTALHDWQKEMLKSHEIDGMGLKNGLVLAPTSGGKTLVAVIMLLRTMLLQRRDTMLILPYVALVGEKVRELKFLSTKVRFFSVAEYAGARGAFPPPQRRADLSTLYVATTEKASVLWRVLCREDARREEIGLAVFDELHMLSDGSRGSVIEELLVSMLHSARKTLRLLAMSATVGNPYQMQMLLGGGSHNNCSVYLVTKRPRQVQEYMVVGRSAVPICRRTDDGKGSISFEGNRKLLLRRDDVLASEKLNFFTSEDDRITAKLVCDAMDKSDSVLVFCGTRNKCVDLCRTLTKALAETHRRAREEEGRTLLLTPKVILEQRQHLIGHLRQESKDMVDGALLEGIAVGIGFHSAALHNTERKAVEDAFAKGIITVLCCTTTLAAGVNLPATRVIIRQPETGGTFLTCTRYIQMIGRAGRGTSDESARSQPDAFIFLSASNVERFENLLERHVEVVSSQLHLEVAFYKRQGAGFTPANYDAAAERRHQLSSSGEHLSFTGVTRIALAALATAEQGVRLLNVIKMFTLTLMYQSGELVQDGIRNTVEQQREAAGCPTHMIKRTIRPILKDMLQLLKHKFVLMLTSQRIEGDCSSPPPVVVDVVPIKGLSVESHVEADSDLDGDPITLAVDAQAKECQNEELLSDPLVILRGLSQQEEEDALHSLEEACQEGQTTLSIGNFVLRSTPFTIAATAGPLSLQDAEAFCKEADLLQEGMRVTDSLMFLYLSITVDMSRPLIDKDHLSSSVSGVNMTHLIDTEIAAKFESRPDSGSLQQLGVTESKVNLWVLGSPTVRKDEQFVNTLTRVWSAMFMKELTQDPEKFEELCKRFGFDRGLALDLSFALSTRCSNIKNFCTALDKYWWYPPMASTMMMRLSDAAKDDIRPLLIIRHVTTERAKSLLQMGIKTVRDVALIEPPTDLAKRIKYLSKWRAVEMVLDARTHVSNEAMVLAAESRDRQEALKNLRYDAK